MRKLFILLAMICCCSFYALAQQDQISSIADIKLPKNAEKIDKKTMLSRSKKMFGNSQMQHSLKTDHLYKIDDVTLNIWDLNQAASDKRSLENIKNELLELYRYDDSIVVRDASIKRYKKHMFLVIKYERGDVGYVKFVSERKNSKSLNGSMEFKKTDQQKADAILDEILDKSSFR